MLILKNREITMKGPSSEHIFTEEFVLQENQTKVVTNSHFFPIDFLYKLCIENNCVSEGRSIIKCRIKYENF